MQVRLLMLMLHRPSVAGITAVICCCCCCCLGCSLCVEELPLLVLQQRGLIGVSNAFEPIAAAARAASTEKAVVASTFGFFLQMMKSLPLLRATKQCSHIRLTAFRTFMSGSTLFGSRGRRAGRLAADQIGWTGAGSVQGFELPLTSV